MSSDLTLAESVKLIENPYAVQIANVFALSYQPATVLPIELITGFEKSYTLIDTLPTSAPRPFGTDFTPSVGSGTTRSAAWKNYGGTFTFDKAMDKGNPRAARENIIMQVQAVAKKWTADLFQGLGASNEMQGIAYFLSTYFTGQIVNGSSTTANGDLLTLAMLDQAVDKLASPTDGSTYFYMTKLVRQRVANLLRAAGVAFPQSVDAFGNYQDTYHGIPIVIMEDEYTGNDILSVTEPDGQGSPANTTSSVWLVKFADDGVKGFGPQAGALSTEVVNPGTHNMIARCEVNTGLVQITPRSAVRIVKVKQAAA